MNEEKAIMDALRPSFAEVCDNKMFTHWVNYEIEIDEIQYHTIDKESLVEYLNKRMAKVRAGSAEQDACVDVASTLEETLPTYQGEFQYV